MTFAQIFQAVQDAAFDASLLTHIKQWVNAREAEVWTYAEWPLKDTNMIPITVTAGTATVSLPAGISFPTQAIKIYDNNGDPLNFLDTDEFNDIYQSSIALNQRSPAESWTLDTSQSGGVVTPTIRIGPVPSIGGTFNIHGWFLPVCRDTATTYKLGLMSADTDRPWWPDELHYFLVPGAIAWGGRQYNSLDWQALEQDFTNGLEVLKKFLIPTPREDIDQWSGNLGYYNIP